MAAKNRKTSLTILEVAWQAWLRCANRYTQGVAASAGVLLLDALLPEQRELLTDMVSGTIPFDRERIRKLAEQSILGAGKDPAPPGGEHDVPVDVRYVILTEQEIALVNKIRKLHHPAAETAAGPAESVLDASAEDAQASITRTPCGNPAKARKSS
jgi:hypothetical protein